MKNRFFQSAFFTIVCLCTLSACNTTTVNTQQIDKINTVAIVAMDGYLEQPEPTGSDPYQIFLEVTRAIANYKGDPDTTAKIYSIFSQKLEQQLGWDIVPLSQVSGNPQYQAMYNKYRVPMQPNTMKSLKLLGLEFDRLKQADRQQLLNALNVDGILLFRMEVKPNTVMQVINDYKKVEYLAKITLRLYTHNQDQPVLHIDEFRGPANEAMVQSWFGISVDDHLAAAIVTAVNAAIEKAFADLPNG